MQQWDDELAKMAWYNAITCEFGHDSCRNTKTFPRSGQNIAANSVQGTNVDFDKPSDIITTQTQSWFDEYTIADMSNIKSFHGSPAGDIGHFTQLVHDKADRVGCALSQYIKPGGWYTTYYVCNYAETNVIGAEIYEDGPTASACKTGTNPNYPGLCSENEKYDY